MQVNTNLINFVVLFLSNLLAWGMTLSNFAFNIVLYFTILSFLLNSSEDILKQALTILPIKEGSISELSSQISISVKGIFFSHAKMALF